MIKNKKQDRSQFLTIFYYQFTSMPIFVTIFYYQSLHQSYILQDGLFQLPENLYIIQKYMPWLMGQMFQKVYK